MRLGVALNPTSGKGRGNTYHEMIEQVLSIYPVDVRWIEVGNPEETRAAMAEAMGELDGLIAVGGDGFIHQAVNAVGDSKVPLGIVAAGSGNDIAREFNLPIHSVEDSLHQVSSGIFAKRCRDVDVIEISWPGGSERALAIVSVGIDADTNLRTNRLSWPRGNMRYVRGLAGALGAYRPYAARLTMDGHSLAGEFTLLSVANTRYFGGGFCISPAASPTDGLLDVVVTPGLTRMDLATLVPKLVLQCHMSDPRVHLFRTRELTIEPLEGAANPLPTLMADGEEICQAPARIKLLPGALRLVV